MSKRNDIPEDEEIIIISKSQQKREAHALTDLGETMVNFSAADLKKVPIDDHLLKAVVEAQGMTRGARKRQIQFIGKLLRKSETEEIQKAVDDILHARESKGRAFKALEKWRERLLSDDKQALTEFCAAFPGADVQRLRQLIRSARKERELEKPPRAFRELFQEIKTIAKNADAE